jgi:hypothetical protein
MSLGEANRICLCLSERPCRVVSHLWERREDIDLISAFAGPALYGQLAFACRSTFDALEGGRWLSALCSMLMSDQLRL